MSYGIRDVRLDHALSFHSLVWKECNARIPDHTLHCNPDWISEHFRNSNQTVSDLDQLDFAEPGVPKPTRKENVRIYLLEDEKHITGVVPYVFDQQQLICGVGDCQLAKFPMHVLTLQNTNNMPPDAAAYDALLQQMLRLDPDAIYVNYVPTDSFFWNYLSTSTLINRSFQFYKRDEPFPHLLIRLDGTFDNYMKKFTSKTRKNRFRELRLLQERGTVALLRVTKACEIDAYLEAASSISKRTWQFDRGWGLRDPELVRRKMEFLAERGWLRSYLLKCGNTPCAFILGHQYGSRFYSEFVGADYQWRRLSVGSVALLLSLQDLFSENTPQLYDFGHYAKWQEYFATESYPEANAWLFSRRVYPQMTCAIYQACNVVSKRTGALLDHYQMKSRIRQWLWSRAIPALGFNAR